MHLTRFRKTDGLTGQSRDPGSQPQVLTFNLLRVAVARLVRRRLEMTRVGPIIIRVITLDPKWLSQRFQLQQDLILTTPKDIRSDIATEMIHRGPEPSGFLLALHETPHVIDFGFVSKLNHHIDRSWVQ